MKPEQVQQVEEAQEVIYKALHRDPTLRRESFPAGSAAGSDGGSAPGSPE